MFAGSGGAAGHRGWPPHTGGGGKAEAWQVEGGGEGDEGSHCDHSKEGDSGAERVRLHWEKNHQAALV